MHARFLAIAASAVLILQSPEICAQEGPCAVPLDIFNGFWGGGQIQARERVAGIPIVATTRFSYRQIRYSPCANGTPVFPPGVGEATISVGVPFFNNRRGGWLLQMAARGQGSQKPGESMSGLVTGAPATAGHINLWETPLPLIQLTGAASATILPQSEGAPISIGYLGGVRLYALYEKRAQGNFGIMVGGSNALVNIVPALAARVSDLPVWGHKLAIGFEFRSPIELSAGAVPLRFRLWGALTVVLDQLEQGPKDRVPGGAQTSSARFDLVRSPPEAAPPAQTAWEMTL